MNGWLNKRLTNVGLTADWWSSAWSLDGPPSGAPQRFLVDNEDGTYDVVLRSPRGDDGHEDETLARGLQGSEVEEVVLLRSRSVTLTIQLDGLRHRDLLGLRGRRGAEDAARRFLALAIDVGCPKVD